MRAAVCLLGCVFASAAGAATLRPVATVNGPVVHVSDLFDDAGPAGVRVLGPAPDPGGRIVVPAGQLAAIARAYGVAWDPDADGDQVVLERPGLPLATDAVLAALKPALVAAGAAADFDIALPFYDPPMLDTGVAPRVTVTQLSLDIGSGRFSALIAVESGLAAPAQLRLSGSIAPSVQVLAPTRRLLAGAIIEADDLALQRVRASQVTVAMVQAPAQAVGMQLRHMEFPGQPVPLADLQHPSVIAKGDRVMMALAMPGLDVGGVGEAMAQGAVGETIPVRNPNSGAVLMGQIVAAGQVRVDPAAPPAQPAAFHDFSPR